MQVLTGIWLDKREPLSKQHDGTIQYVLLTFLLLNILQILMLVVLAYLYRSRWGDDREMGMEDVAERPTPVSEGYTLVDQSEAEIDPNSRGSSPTMEEESLFTPLAVLTDDQSDPPNPSHKDPEIRRARIFACACIILICFCWLLFLGTTLFQLRSKEDRDIPQRNVG